MKTLHLFLMLFGLSSLTLGNDLPPRGISHKNIKNAFEVFYDAKESIMYWGPDSKVEEICNSAFEMGRQLEKSVQKTAREMVY